MRRPKMLLFRSTLALVALSLGLLAGCNPPAPKTNIPVDRDGATLGELVYRVIKGNLERSESCPGEFVAALEQNHTDFVTTFDHAINENVTNDFPNLLGGTLHPLVENGRLPELVDVLANALALLISNEFDPNRQTLGSIANLSTTRTMLEGSMAIDLVTGLLGDPTIEDKIHALAALAQEPEGSSYIVDSLMGVAASQLDADTTSMCSGLVLDDVQGTLLRTTGFTTMGTAVPMARPDANGNPAVRRDASNKLFAPFVDANMDGVADVDAQGRPIDVNGAPIDIPVVGTPSSAGRDAQGRALNAQGGLLYDYYDVQQTALAHGLRIGIDLFEDGLLHDVPEIARAALGSQVSCNANNAGNCPAYSTTVNPVADLLYMVFEIGKYNRVLALVDTIHALLTTNPAKADDLMVALGDFIVALDASTLSITDTGLLDMGIGLSPLLEDVLNAPNTAGKPTARLLVDLIYNLGAAKNAIPGNIAYMVEFAPNGTTRIDYTRSRFYTSGNSTIDNRSGLERLIELFDYADCGHVGPGDFSVLGALRTIIWNAIKLIDGNVHEGSLASVFVEMLSHQSPNTVSNLIALLDAIQGIVGNNTLSWVVENVFQCEPARAAATAAHLPALRSLANSGGLNWILPLAKVFGDQGQLRTLISIFSFVAEDLRQAELGLPSYFRQIEPPLLSAIKTGAVGKLLGALDILYTVPASDGNGTAVDVVIDALSRVVTTQASLKTRMGLRGNTSLLIETLKPLKTVMTRINANSAGDELGRVLDSVTGLLTATTGTGANRNLADPNILPLLVVAMEVAHDAADLPAAQYTCYMNEAQSSTTAALTGKSLATLVRVLSAVDTSPNFATLEPWIIQLMRPSTAQAASVYGPLMQIAAAALSTTASGDDLANVIRWLEGVSAQDQTSIRRLIAVFDDILTADTNGTILQIVRNMIEPGPLMSMETPLETFARTFGDVAQVDSGNMCMMGSGTLDAQEMESVVAGVVDFLTAEQGGMGQVWDLVSRIAASN